MKMHRQYASLVTDIASDFGETIGEMIATGELSLKNFLRETIMMALDALERVIEISILEITAKIWRQQLHFPLSVPLKQLPK